MCVRIQPQLCSPYASNSAHTCEGTARLYDPEKRMVSCFEPRRLREYDTVEELVDEDPTFCLQERNM
jgi:hypothetical protein